MHENYQSLVNDIQVPEGLNDRVLSAAKRPAAGKNGLRPLWRAAVCAVCVLALVAGSFGLGQQAPPLQEEAAPKISFMLTAYAAEGEGRLVPNANGGLAFLSSGERMLSAQNGCYTGCLFRIEGAGIETVTVSVDRGGLYREESTAMAAVGEGTKTILGSTFSTDYDPDASYGFWIPAEEIAPETMKNMKKFSFDDAIDTFDGGQLHLEITGSNGGTLRKTYALSTGFLKTSWEEDGTITMLPELTADSMEGLYGIYGVSLEDSRWFQWPVEGANTVSLSNSYGFRAAPGGEGGTFHAGIDIPAQQGTPVRAAVDGEVTEVGFEPDRGNYLVLDHGDGLTTTYGQCLSVAVEQWDEVAAGQVIAAVGSTGKSTGPHLHFEVRQDGEAQNPVAYFDADVRDTLKME